MLKFEVHISIWILQNTLISVFQHLPKPYGYMVEIFVRIWKNSPRSGVGGVVGLGVEGADPPSDWELGDGMSEAGQAKRQSFIDNLFWQVGCLNKLFCM